MQGGNSTRFISDDQLIMIDDIEVQKQGYDPFALAQLLQGGMIFKRPEFYAVIRKEDFVNEIIEGNNDR